MTMTFKQTMAELKALGTEQNIKVYRKHGATGELFGVSFANLDKLKKEIGVDHALAVELWESANADARVLATMVADPEKLAAADADRWVKQVDYYVVSDALAGLVGRCEHVKARIKKWTAAKSEYVRATGYTALAHALKNGVEFSAAEGTGQLERIETDIHSSPNRARYAMNNALIALGVFLPALTEAAVQTAERIGPVEVDHGDTSCRTPYAPEYIKKTVARRQKQ